MKTDKLEKLKKECIKISKEPIVFGEGNPDASIVLVGEAPGAKEIELKRPFVGQAGKNLEEFLEVLELKREDIYITNVVKIRPYKINEKTGRKSNRAPNQEEIKKYEKYLFEEINIIKPKVIVTLGNVPLKSILKDKKATIGSKHGTVIEMDKFFVFPLYHPASIIYRRELKNIYLEDLYKLKNFKERIEED
ncbi:uracil-DNA glycosylase [Crassaminicella thermophila]|uniref:Type-4 uracil-DNA glycosylase n=1 Tax=Crassaminicella thermophila TaxID=2599308 RepID=A0A5C0SDA0_CRATE|nr:uracil-DNA glycosylase [Crassaminicella thermophila]QEK10899.1 uracil-DNA glycosylase [Crassaminicella thermophila]